MGLFSRKKSVTFSTSFIPLDLISALVGGGLSANQQKFLELYLQVPELQAIINYKARVFAGMKIRAVNEADEQINIPQLNLFAEPNPLQNFKEFATQYYVLRAIFGNEFIHPVFGNDRLKVQALWNLPPMRAEVIPVENDLIPFNMTKKEELIKGYKFFYNNKEIQYEPDEIIHFNDNQVQFKQDEILLGDSKLRPLVQACENIKAAYESRGVMIQNSALGVLANSGTDQQGSTQLAPKDKEQLQEDFKRYGLTKKKWQVILTNASLSWQSMATDVGKLKVFEEVEADFQTIANAHNFPPEVLQTKGTYENKQKALTQLYQEAIIPEADEWLQGLGNWMGLTVTLKSDFSHIAALQQDKERMSRAINWAATGLSKAVETQLITIQEGQEEMKKYLS